MATTNLHSAGHLAARKFFRIAGPVIGLIGAIFSTVGVVDFFSAMNQMGGHPQKFWCLFVGFPLVFVGLVFCQFGFLGAVTRYVAAEQVPVAKDAFNYLAENTKEGVTAVAKSVAAGFNASQTNRQTGSDALAAKSPRE